MSQIIPSATALVGLDITVRQVEDAELTVSKK